MKLEVEYVGFESLIDHVFDKSEAFQEFFSQGKTLNAIIGKNRKRPIAPRPPPNLRHASPAARLNRLLH